MKDWQVTGEEDEDIQFIYRYCDGTAQPVVEEYRCWFPNFTNTQYSAAYSSGCKIYDHS